MKKMFLSILIIASLMNLSVSGQRPIRRFCLQDDRTGAQLVFFADGNYSFTTCQFGASAQGVGRVKVSGCRVTLTDVTRHQIIQAELDTCDSSGKASVRVESCPTEGPTMGLDGSDRIGPICGPFSVTLTDSNLKDSVCACN